MKKLVTFTLVSFFVVTSVSGCSKSSFSSNTEDANLIPGNGKNPGEKDVDKPKKLIDGEPRFNPPPVGTPGPTAIFEGASYHLGNGNFAKDATCSDQFKPMSEVGKIYNFPFSVLDEKVDVQISLTQICGVTGTGTANTVKFLHALTNRPVRAEAIYLNSVHNGTTLSIPAYAGLAKGDYVIRVESGDVNGRDDFIIGRIQVSGNGNLQKGQESFIP